MDDRPPAFSSPRRARPNATRPPRRRLSPRSTRTPPPSPPQRTPEPHRAPPRRSPRRRPRPRSRPGPATRDASPRTFWIRARAVTHGAARRPRGDARGGRNPARPRTSRSGAPPSEPPRRATSSSARSANGISWPVGNVEAQTSVVVFEAFLANWLFGDWIVCARDALCAPIFGATRFLDSSGRIRPRVAPRASDRASVEASRGHVQARRGRSFAP